jgi:hypothetical protein
MRRLLDRLATPTRILFVGFLLVLVYAYPGYMSTDSVDQLMQAREGQYRDWHPPLMAWMWRRTDRIIAGPFPMLVIQVVTFLLGAYGILRHAMSERRAAITASAILLAPPVLTQMAVIWKDCQMAGFLLAGTAAILSPKRGWKIAGLVMLAIANAERHNAFAATFVVVLVLFVWRDGLTRWRRYLVAFGVWCLIAVAALGVNRALTDVKTHPWHGSLALFDIAGTIRFTHPFPDEEAKEVLAGVPGIPTENIRQRFWRKYDSGAWWWLANNEGAVLTAPQTQEERDAVARAWYRLVTEHPRQYLFHRWRVFQDVLGMTDKVPAAAVWEGFTEMPGQLAVLGHDARHSAVQQAWLDVMKSLEKTFLFRAWVYFVIALALLPLCRRRRLAFAVLASGIAYELTLFVAAPSRDFRYSHWMIVATLVGASLLFAERWREGRAAMTASPR